MMTQPANTEKAIQLVKRSALASMAIGLVPLPLVHLAGNMAMQLQLLKRLGEIYDQNLSDELGKKAIATLLSGMAPTALLLPAASILWMVPLVGHAVALFSMPILCGASTYALGMVFIQHFESGGSLLTFDPEKMKSQFRKYFDEGTRFAAHQSQVQSAAQSPQHTVDPEETGEPVADPISPRM